MARSTRLAQTFDLRARGLKRLLGELESEVMESVWKRDEATVRDVHAVITKRRDLAYTTIMTVMSRLAEKGLLVRREEGRAMVYEPAMSREEFMSEAATAVLTGLLKDFARPTMSQLVEIVGNESEERIDELLRLVEERRGRE